MDPVGSAAAVSAIQGRWHIVGTGDFNDDGEFDILWQNDNGQAAIWLMNGATATAEAAIGTNPGPSWHVIGTGDFNHDGYADILWQNDNGEAYIWEMNGTNVIGQGSLGNPGPSWHAKGTGDFSATPPMLPRSAAGSAARFWSRRCRWLPREPRARCRERPGWSRSAIPSAAAPRSADPATALRPDPSRSRGRARNAAAAQRGRGAAASPGPHCAPSCTAPTASSAFKARDELVYLLAGYGFR